MNNSNRRIYLLCTVTFLYWFSLYAYVPIFSPYLESIGASYKMIGLILGSYGFVQTILRIPLGLISDILKKRKIFIMAGLICSLVSSLGLWYFREPVYALIFRSLTGFTAAIWIMITVLFSSYFDPNEAPKAIGIIHSFLSLGQVTAMIVSGILSYYYGMSVSFLIAAIGAFVAVVVSFAITEKSVTEKQFNIKEFRDIFSNRILILVSILAMISQIITQATIFGFTPIVAKHIGASSLEIYFLTISSIAPAIAVSYLSGTFFAKKYGFSKTIVVAFILSGIPSFFIPLIKSIRMLYVLQIISGVGRGAVFPLLMGLSIKTVEENKRVAAMGFFQAVYGIGMFVGPLLVGLLSDTVGITGGFLATGIFGLFGSILSALFLNSKRTVELANGDSSGSFH